MTDDKLIKAFDEIFDKRFGRERHWACGRIDCNCDELTDRARDEMQRDEQEILTEHETQESIGS